MRKCEVLSPVGNEEMLFAAVRSGADAVYFGAQHFNARRSAENFDADGIENAIKYCHKNGVKAYLTLNIVVSDREFSLAVETAKWAHKCGIDAIIVADLGLASYLKLRFPKIVLHGSTQMTIHSVSAIPIIKKAGLKRVVLSREMSAKQIENFCLAAKENDIETEVFVHGALCMSVSGQCYLSAMLGSRSGNRGLCAGPCRLPFSAGGTGYDLSLKDNSLIEHIEQLVKMGVNSLKIEGRMKRPEYVAAATAAVAEAVEGKKHGAVSGMLEKVFSRQGLTDGYFTETLGKEMFGTRTRDDVLAANQTFSSIHKIYRKEVARVPVTAEFVLSPDCEATLKLSDGQNKAIIKGTKPEKAIKRSIDFEIARTALSKLGGTPYFMEKFNCNIAQNLSYSVSGLNSLRRSAVEKLDQLRTQAEEIEENKEIKPLLPIKKESRPKTYCRFENVEQMPKDISGIETIILPLESKIDDLKPYPNIKYGVDIPRGILSEKEIEKELEKFKKKGFIFALCGNIAAIEIAKRCGFDVMGDFGLNVYNSQTAAFFEQNNLTELVLSPELRIGEAVGINCSPKGIISYGRLPLMLMRNCPLKNGKNCAQCDKKGFITDRRGVKFPIRCRMGFSEMLNSVPINLSDKQKDLDGLDFQILYFTDENSKKVEQIITDYKNNTKPIGEYTRGLYYRGVE